MSEPFDPYHVWLGIPPDEQPPNHYRLLGLQPYETNLDVISNALDQRRAFLRTFQAGKRGPLSQRLLNEVSAAGVCLLDAAKKRAYDSDLRARAAVAPPGQAATANDLPVEAAALPLSALPLPSEAKSAALAQPPAFRGMAPPRIRSTKHGQKPSSLVAVAIVISCVLATVLLGGGAAWYVLLRAPPAAVADAPGATDIAQAASDGVENPSLAPSKQADSADNKPGEAAPSTPPEPPSAPPVQPPDAETASPGPKGKAKRPPAGKLAKGKAAPPPAQPPTVQPPSVPSPSEPPSAPPPLAVTGRQPVPSGEALAKTMASARQIYESGFKAATKTSQKADLGKQILAAGKSTQNDWTARYALIDLARKVLAQAAEQSEALAAARLLEAEFDIPREKLVSETVETLADAPLILEQRTELAKLAADMAEAAIDADEFDRAERLSLVAVQSAAKLRDAEIKRDLIQRRSQVASVVKQWNALQPSLEKLASEPNDPAANLAAGKFYFFTLEDVARGLVHLAAGGESPLAQAARLDLVAHPNGSPEQRFAAAAAWKEAQAKLDRDDKFAAQRRERWLLQQVGRLSSQDTVKVNKRLDELKDIGKPRSTTRSTARQNTGLIGRVLAGNNNDTGIVIGYEPGYALTNDDFLRLKKLANAGQWPLKVQLVGGFVLPANQTVVVRQSVVATGNSSFRVFIDNKGQGTVGGGQPSSSSRTLNLTAGPHHVRWEWNGADFNGGLLEVVEDTPDSPGSGPPVPFLVDRTLEAAARQSPVRGTLHFGSGR